MNRIFIFLFFLLFLHGIVQSHDLGVSRVSIRVVEEKVYINAEVPISGSGTFAAPEVTGYDLLQFNIDSNGQLSAQYTAGSAQAADQILFPWDRQGLMVTLQVNDLEQSRHYIAASNARIEVILSDLTKPQSTWEKVSQYTSMGIEHILMGLDHLLFILGLLFIVRGARSLLLTITAFTLAHSITLALAAFNILVLDPAVVDILVALSILFLGVEILKNYKQPSTLAGRKPWLVAFVFGLVHGLGFAGALKELGLPINEIPLVLLLFNIGVELGQLTFIGILLILVRSYEILGYPAQKKPAIPAYVIGISASIWFFARIFELFDL